MRTFRKTLAAILSALLAAPAWAQERLTFSPNADGVKDEVTFKLSLQQDAQVGSWLFEIKEETGVLVKTFTGKGRPPAELQWDGKDLSNRLVKDGIYLFTLGLVTPAGNQVAIAPSPLIVDRAPPAAEASVEPSLFSPNGDGVKDETQFNLKAFDPNGIHSWLLTIKDSEGAPARAIGGKGAPPAAVRWDGRGDFEEDVPDGAYTFELTVHDFAGNRAVTSPQKVAINRAGLVSTVEVVPMLISPNGDGFRDEVLFKLASGDPDSVDRWALRIMNRNGKPVHEFSGHGAPPQRIPWSGLAGKKALADGSYQVMLSETDRAGNTASTTPQPLEIDTAPPILAARLEPGLLSPNGDGNQDSGSFALKADDEHPLERWSLTVSNDVGRAAKTFSGSAGSRPPAKVAYEGLSEDGQPLIDGAYGYVLEAADAAGNKAATPKQTFRIDRTPPLLSVSADPLLFSPNGDGVLDATAFKPTAQDAGPLQAWRLSVSDAKGTLVRSFTGPADAVPPSLPWDGKSNDRAPLPDGEYSFVLSAVDVAGNRSETPPQKLILGAGKPVPSAKADLAAISPNADGYKDEASFKLEVRSFSRIQEWTLKISDKLGAAHRSFSGRGDVPGVVSWRGERDDKRPMADGDYVYALEVVDVAGNRVSSPAQPIRIDTAKPELVLSLSPDLFSPNGDGTKDDASFLPGYKDASPAAEWQIEVRDPSKRTVKTFSGKDKLPLSVPWKGGLEEGRALPDGSYTYVFSAADEVGNRASTPEGIARIDNSAPQASLQVDPPLFSPNGDGAKDETTFLLDAKDVSDISSWMMSVTGKEGHLRNFKGVGRPPRSFPWEGKNDRGNPVPDGTYSCVLSVTDEVGNTGKSPAVDVKVDTSKPLVTVTAETETLQELTPQMTVTQTQGDLVIALSSEVLFDTGQSVVKTQAYTTLTKAVHLIRRYPRRKVRIEGHADNVPIRNAQFKDNLALSEGRAKAVLDFFAEKGSIDRARMSSQGFGDAKPKASNDTEEGRRINRRVEIILMKEAKE